MQQVLLDVGTVEGVDGTKRYVDHTGAGVLMDVDDLQNLKAAGDGLDVPRLTPPLRLIRDNAAATGGRSHGKSGILFPMMDPHGVHSFPAPSPDLPFDLGSLLVNQAMRYLATGGQQLDFDLDGKADMRIQLNTSTNATALDPLDSRVLSANEVVTVHNSRLLRVSLMKKTELTPRTARPRDSSI